MGARSEIYCRRVTQHMRCKWERPQVARELLDHLEDHREALQAAGMDRVEAEEAAVAAMGDPEALGRALDRLHSPWPWRIFHGAAALSVFLALTVAWALAAGHSNSGGLGWLLWEEGLFSPSTAQVWAEASQLSENEVLLATGTASGGGTIGPYRLRAWEEAQIAGSEGGYYHFEGLGSYDAYLALAASCVHWEPWLEPLSVPRYALSAVDDRGNTYGPGQLYMDYRGGRLLGSQWIVLSDPDPDASRFTITVDTDQGAAVFTVELEKGGAA